MLRGERLQVSFDLRRDIGIRAGIVGLIHTGVGHFVHMAGASDFKSVAKRLGCNEDKATLEAKLGKIAKAKTGRVSCYSCSSGTSCGFIRAAVTASTR